MFYSILLNLKSLFLYRKRYLVSQILTFTALSFVVLTAAKVIAAHSEVADFANTNIYTFAIREDAQPADLAAALNGFGELANENDVVQVFANPPGEDSWLLVGTNAFVDEFWYQQNVEEDFILTDEFYAWMDPDFWGDSASLDFPYASVQIRENSYTVAGVVDMPLYNMAGLAIRNGVFIPLRNYLACGYPIQSVTLRLYRPPSAQTHAAIASLFNPYAGSNRAARPSLPSGGLGQHARRGVRAFHCAVPVSGCHPGKIAVRGPPAIDLDRALCRRHPCARLARILFAIFVAAFGGKSVGGCAL